MAVSRQHVATLNQILVAKDREELAAEAKITQLLRELEAVKLGATEAKPGESIGNFAASEAERQAASTKLAEARRRNQANSAQLRRSAADVQKFQRELRETLCLVSSELGCVIV
ncbi:unnamed protein product [Symbiodinium pilosum]|uniref:Uncharacterized protein n=1 Tax=Symbiodinium pilosum TaxID=2952 RepID=A0A812KN80_SYMPI|nr:unnamed protein product [Symbiodinium pilosum]